MLIDLELLRLMRINLNSSFIYNVTDWLNISALTFCIVSYVEKLSIVKWSNHMEIKCFCKNIKKDLKYFIYMILYFELLFKYLVTSIVPEE